MERVLYVALTRAKHTLVIAHDHELFSGRNGLPKHAQARLLRWMPDDENAKQFAALAFLLVQVLVDVLYRFVLLQQFGGGLFSDPAHAGNVIRRVTDQPLVIGDLIRADTVLFHHARMIVKLRARLALAAR